MRVFVACEQSGVVRDAFRRLGHEAWSCDLEGIEAEGEWSNYHLYGDCRWFLDSAPGGEPWDLMIAHPPCTYLSVSGLHWNGRVPGRAEKTEEALLLVRDLLAAPVDRICLENPVSCISSRIRRPDQIIQPHQFGHDASKTTCLWLKNLPPLEPTAYVAPRLVGGRKRWANQTDSGQNRLGPSEDRQAIRSRTYEGIAKAMAETWSGLK